MPSRADYPDPDRIPTRPGPHVAGELDDTHDEGAPRAVRVRVRTPDMLSAELVAELVTIRRQLAGLESRLLDVEHRTAPKKPWRRKVRALVMAVPISAVAAAAIYAVNAIADARVAAAKHLLLVAEVTRHTVEILALQLQVAAHDAAIKLLSLLRGSP